MNINYFIDKISDLQFKTCENFSIKILSEPVNFLRNYLSSCRSSPSARSNSGMLHTRNSIIPHLASKLVKNEEIMGATLPNFLD